MIDWVSLVFIALLIYCFGKAEFHKGKIAGRVNQKSDEENQVDKKESEKAMTFFGLFFVFFMLRTIFPDLPDLQELLGSL